jgi:hypothetical protein
MTRPARRRRRKAAPILLLAAAATAPGCAAAHLIGVMGATAEYQKLITKQAAYADLTGAKVAVMVSIPPDLGYEHPQLAAQLATGVSARIQANVTDVTVVRPDQIIAWQWRTHDWESMPYGELARAMGVDRVVYVDVHEYRLNPPGNRWLWEGVCSASVSVIESDYPDPDMFAATFEVISEYPDLEGLDRDSASPSTIEAGLLARFIERAAWLFYDHQEPKYPDKYRPELEG